MTRRLAGVQSLRGIACLAVVLYHTADIEARFGLRYSPLRPLLWFGYAGVDLFFVLSGFVIATSVGDRRGIVEVPGFLARRAWRVFPPFWAALALAAVMFQLLSGESVIGPKGLPEVIDQVFLLPTESGQPPRLLPVAWTLSFEGMFYAAFGLLLALPQRGAMLGWMAWAAVVIGNWGHVPADRFARLAVSPHVLEFLAGVLVAHLPGRVSARQKQGVMLAALVWVAGGSWLAFSPDPIRLAEWTVARVSVFGPAAAVVVWATAARERAGGVVRGRWLPAVGEASYSIYLVHVMALLLFLHVSHQVGWRHSRLPHLLWIGASVSVAVAAGFALHYAVERPLLAWGRRVRVAPRTKASVGFRPLTPSR